MFSPIRNNSPLSDAPAALSIVLSLWALSIAGRSLAAPSQVDLIHKKNRQSAAAKVAAYDSGVDNIPITDASARSGPPYAGVLTAGQKATRRYTVVNDRLNGTRLQIRLQPTLRSGRTQATPLAAIVRVVTAPPGGRTILPVEFSLPSVPVNTLLELTVTVSKNGKERFRKTDRFLVVPPGPAATQAIFLGRDDRTGGNWRGRYGKQAFFLPIRTGTASFCDSGISISRGVPSVYRSDHIISDTTPRQDTFEVLDKAWKVDDPRIPLAGNGLTTRDPIAFATQHSAIPMDVRIDTEDGKPHRLSLYFVDYKRTGRPMKLELYDRQNHLLASHRLSDYGNGAYLCFRFTGSVVALIRSLTDAKPILSGIFVDPDTGMESRAH